MPSLFAAETVIGLRQTWIVSFTMLAASMTLKRVFTITTSVAHPAEKTDNPTVLLV